MKRRLLIATIFAAALASGCQKADTPAPAAAAPKVPQAAAPAPTAKDWRDALAAAYVESDKKSEGDGVYNAWACFDTEVKDPPKVNKDGRQVPCPQQGMRLTRDGFRKITFFTPPHTNLMEFNGKYSGGGPYLGSYVALPDCDKPSYFLRATFDGKTWLFMNKVAVMVNGEIVLEQDFKGTANVKRDVEDSRVSERYDFIATPQQIEGIQKAIGPGEVLLRLTGDKGYVSLDPKNIESLRDDARRMKLVYEKLTKSLQGKIPASCS